MLSFLLTAGNVTVQILLNVSQPILSKGQLHWAFNNVATYLQPSCTSLLGSLYAEKQGYLSSNQLAAAAPAKDISLQQYSDSSEPVQVSPVQLPRTHQLWDPNLQCT